MLMSDLGSRRKSLMTCEADFELEMKSLSNPGGRASKSPEFSFVIFRLRSFIPGGI
jgi:hypothetical protein